MNTENNNIIAEFMGWEILDKYCDPYPKNVEVDSLPMLEFMFNSWDELMEVVDKISEMILDFVFENSDELEKFYDLGLKNITYSNDEIKISITQSLVYEDTISFIKWHNEQKQN